MDREDDPFSKYFVLAAVVAGTGLLASYSFLATAEFFDFALFWSAVPIISFTAGLLASLAAIVTHVNNAVWESAHFQEIENLMRAAELARLDHEAERALNSAREKIDAGIPNQLPFRRFYGHMYTWAILVGLLWPTLVTIYISGVRILEIAGLW